MAALAALAAAGCKQDAQPGGGPAGAPSAGTSVAPSGDQVELSILYLRQGGVTDDDLAGRDGWPARHPRVGYKSRYFTCRA